MLHDFARPCALLAATLFCACTPSGASPGAHVLEESSPSDRIVAIGELPALKCEGLTPLSVALDEVEWTLYENRPGTGTRPDLVDVSRDVYLPFFDVNPAAWDPTSAAQVRFEHNLRFDYCVAPDGTASLERLVVGLADFRVRIINPRVPGARITGAPELAFLATDGVSMDIPLQGGDVFRLREFKPQRFHGAEAPTAIFYGIGKPLADARIDPLEKRVVVGKLQSEVDPFGKCAVYEKAGAFLEQQLSVDGIRIDAGLCVGSVGGDTFSYSVVELKVTHPRLSEISQGHIANNTFEAKGQAASRVWKEKLTHHSTCDQFVLKIPHFATIGVTAAPFARADGLEGCSYFHEAPRPANGDRKALFRVNYADGSTHEGSLESRFYFDEEALGEIEQ